MMAKRLGNSGIGEVIESIIVDNHVQSGIKQSMQFNLVLNVIAVYAISVGYTPIETP